MDGADGGGCRALLVGAESHGSVLELIWDPATDEILFRPPSVASAAYNAGASQ